MTAADVQPHVSWASAITALTFRNIKQLTIEELLCTKNMLHYTVSWQQDSSSLKKHTHQRQIISHLTDPTRTLMTWWPDPVSVCVLWGPHSTDTYRVISVRVKLGHRSKFPTQFHLWTGTSGSVLALCMYPITAHCKMSASYHAKHIHTCVLGDSYHMSVCNVGGMWSHTLRKTNSQAQFVTVLHIPQSYKWWSSKLISFSPNETRSQ